MNKLLSILLTTAILFAEDSGSNYFTDNFLKYSTFYFSAVSSHFNNIINVENYVV